MKLYRSFVIVFVILLISASCKKDNGPVNISLKDKPLFTIKSSIQGRWKLEYSSGGICGICVYPSRSNTTLEFKKDRVIWISDNLLLADDNINWIPTHEFFGIDTYIMSFEDTRAYPYNYIVDGIYNDTLVLYESATDGQSHHFSKLR
jgi:hypothetical protein